MTTPIRTLIVEDSADDAVLLIYELQSAGFDPKWKRVETESDYRASLRQPLDIVLSDFSLPRFSVARALELLHESQLEVPFIIVSGTIGEERAVESLKAGATDYVLKDHIERLGPSVWRALRETQVRAERKRAEESLRRSEERYRALIDDAQDSIFTLSPTGEITSLNPAFEATSGWSRSEWIGKHFAPMIHVDDLPQALGLFQRVMRGEKPSSFELRVIPKTGGPVTLEFKVTPQFHDGTIVGILGIGRDVTQRKELEAQFRQAQKMESIGQLAGGIAHDFNNILTVIQGHASLIQTSEKLSPDGAESIHEVLLAAEHAASLTRQLLTFSRRQVIQRRNLDLNEVVSSVTKMLRRVLGEDITLQFDSSTELPPISADPGMIEQVLMNLAVNARDAMPRGGRLIISTTTASIGEDVVRQNPEASVGDFVCMTVTDTGVGIPKENLPRIFEPFFTTKEVGKGTGLGLATVYGIVKQHQGWITIDSEVNRGTTFRIYLPAQPPGNGIVKPKPMIETIRGGSETILLAEDEAALRLLVRNVLESYGYRIIESPSAIEALKAWRKYHGNINLLLTDLVMPGGMSGRELADKVREQNPKLKVIFMSGYSAEIVGKDFTLREGINFLQKPYHPRKLVQCVRDCLDSSKT